MAPRLLFLVTLLTGSFLLFLIQPMIARMALPRLGGAPAVWNSAMLVYQALLLGGYAYAHALGRLAPRRQAIVHLSFFAVAALWLPVGLSAATPGVDASPLLWVPWLLAASIGPLFFVVAAQAPLMQRWFGLTSNADPYPLYAASNLGSFAGLLSYPLLVEPGFALGGQSLLWSALYIVLVFLVAACGMGLPRAAPDAAADIDSSPAPTKLRYARWILLAAVPSGLMLSTSSHLTTDIVAVPLLWVMPLGLYLLSFTVAFAANRRPAEIVTLMAPLLILSIGGLAFANASRHPAIWGAAGLVLLFVVAVALHAEMYRTRPGVDHLTGFYLAMSVGGVCGGIFGALVAPAVFDWTYEHPLLILAAGALVPQVPLFAWLERFWARPCARTAEAWLIVAAIALAVLAGVRFDMRDDLANALPLMALTLIAVAAIGRPLLYTVCLAGFMLGYGGWHALEISQAGMRTRSYFGVYTVADRPSGNARILMHGTTMHGLQLLQPGLTRVPTTYYAARSGVGLPLTYADALFGPNARIGVVGLGTGTLACYKQPGQSWTFFEIDPAVVAIARDPRRFTFMSQCAPDARIVLGDARLMLARAAPASLDLIALDAFSSDAVPMHLLTREAFAIYARTMAPDALLLVHISNRYLDLKPILAGLDGWSAAVRSHEPTLLEREDSASGSEWVAMARDRDAIDRLVAIGGEHWTTLKHRPGVAAWTDDYATILPLFKAR